MTDQTTELENRAPLADLFKGIRKPAEIKILHVEDHPATRQVMVQMLESVGFQVLLANDGQQGIAQARQFLPDIILMDLRMPTINGFEAIKTLRTTPETAHIPIIVISAWANAKHKQHALEVGANEHYSKPILFGQLISLLEKYLA